MISNSPGTGVPKSSFTFVYTNLASLTVLPGEIEVVNIYWSSYLVLKLYKVFENYFPLLFPALTLGLDFVVGLLLLNPRDFFPALVNPLMLLF